MTILQSDFLYLSIALQRLAPNALYVVRDGEIEWQSEDIAQPTDEQIEATIETLKQEHIDNLYKNDRRKKYPPLADLADAIYWQQQGDNTKMDAYLAAVQAVKDAYPKP